MNSTSQPATRVERRRQDNLERVLSAAARLFARTGYFETSMASIAEAADVSVGTLYNLFDNKEALYAELVTSKAEAIHQRILAASARGQSPIEGLEAVLEEKMAIVVEEHEFIRFFFSSNDSQAFSRKSALPTRVQEIYEEGTRRTAEIIAGALPGVPSREREALRLAVVVQAATTELFLLHLESPDEHPAAELLTEAKRQLAALIGDKR